MLAPRHTLNPFTSTDEWEHYASLARRETVVGGVPDLYVRNLGFHSLEEQRRLQDATLAISGGGGDGGEIARLAVRAGIGCGRRGEIRLADPEAFAPENINRQSASAADTIGENKAVAVARLLLRINPALNVKVYMDGVTPENIEDFVKGADVVLDEAAFERHELAVMTNRTARQYEVPVIQGMNLGWAGIVTTMHPHGAKFERQLGFVDSDDLANVAESRVPLRHWIPYIPFRYGDYGVLEATSTGIKPAPSIAEGMSVTAARTVLEVKLNLWSGGNRRKLPTYFRWAEVVDLYSGRTKRVRYTDLSYYTHGARAWIRDRMLHLNPVTDFALHPDVVGTEIDWPPFMEEPLTP